MPEKLGRRAFLVRSAAAGGGLALAVRFPLLAADPGDAAAPEVNAWVVVRPDDTVVIRIARSEMGQGSLTGLAQLVAEELECDWSRVTTEYPTPGESVRRNRPWGMFGTYGSLGIRQSQEYLRSGGAAARVMLVQAAANRWGVPAAECRAANSVITHSPSGRTLSFGAVADDAARLEPPADIALKPATEWKLIGRPVRRLDTPPKVTGELVYGADLRFPGMLNAAVTKFPVFGVKLGRFDAGALSGLPGIAGVVAVGDDAVAVVAESWWVAKTALDRLPVEWDEGAHGDASSATIRQSMAEGLDADEGFVGNSNGDARGALAAAARTLTAEYSFPFQNHATMEPMNATVRYTPERCEAWVPTQDGENAFTTLVGTCGLPPERCEVHKLHLGGGFGRRTVYQDYLVQATRIAMQFPGRHVKLLWSREEDMAQGRYHPMMLCRLQAALDENGGLEALHMRLSGQSILASVFPDQVAAAGGDRLAFQGLSPEGDYALGYGIPHLLIDHVMRNSHLPPGYWRGVNANQNTLFLECFMDELAEAAGANPLEYRRRLMREHPRHLNVLNAVADRVRWDSAPPPGMHRGIAQAKDYASYVAAACELSVGDGGRVKIHRMVVAIDCGYAVNPAQIERQVAGSIAYSLSALFLQECTVADGRVQQGNFDTYPLLRLAQMPRVETLILPGGGIWGGVGEPATCVTAPAVLNALYRATGRRIRNPPLKNHGFVLGS
jgi:isoquinoline 1-oxidoreductase beta subunit